MRTPRVDIDAAKNHIRAHARACHPYECCGLIVGRGKKQRVVCGRNVAADPRHRFVLHPDDYKTAEKMGDVAAIYHSHVDESPEPSPGDKAMAEAHRLPLIIVSWPSDQWSVYKPNGWRAELVGRPFVYGILDCWQVVVDCFGAELGVELKTPVQYGEDWWKRGQDLYREHLPGVGFVKVSAADLRPYDLILMQLDSPVPNHVAVYRGDGMMLHHPPGHLSGEHPYVCDQGYYAKCTVGFYRHESRLEAAAA